MDKKRSVVNVIVSMMFKIIILIGNLLVRRYLIRFLGNDINGVNSLYLSIIGVLSVVELGIGEAIVFCMYKPIVEGNVEKVNSLYNLFKKIYFIIGLIIFAVGLLLMPFLPYLAKDYATLNVNLYLTFGLMLVSIVLTYFFSAKTSLMTAYKDNYLSTTISSVGQILQQVAQIVVLFVSKSFVLYLICRIVAVLVQWCLTNLITRKKYSFIGNSKKIDIDLETKKEITKNVKAMFMHRIGDIFVNTVDSLVISAFIGVSILGKYSNYTTIMISMSGLLVLFFVPLTSTIGHFFVKDKDGFRKYYNFFIAFNFILGVLFFLGYYSIIDDLIFLIFGPGLELDKSISFVITVNYFIQFLRQSTILFRNASGTFYHDRWKPIVEAFSNLILSILFVLLFKKIAGDEFAVVGVIVATIITNILICHIVEPSVLYKHVFNEPARKGVLKNYVYIIMFVVSLLILDFLMIKIENKMVELLVNGCIAVGLSIIPIIAILLIDKDFKSFMNRFLRKIRHIK